MSNNEYNNQIDLQEHITFVESLNKLLKIDTRDEYYIVEEVFGYGLEIEVSAQIKRTHITFLKTMLLNIINVVNYRGNFVTDRTITGDYGFEICLDPLSKDECLKIYSKIKEIINFSNGVLTVEKKFGCGLHLNIKAEERIKREKFTELFELIDINNNDIFTFNEYKRFITNKTFDEYLAYQKDISGKYLAINLLKNNLIEIRCVNPEISIENLESLLNNISNIFGGNDESSSSSSSK